MSEFKQTYMAAVTAALFVALVPVLWLYSFRTITDHNQKTTTQVTEQRYQDCIKWTDAKSVPECQKLREPLK